jgi:DNA-binding transcriptional ArsR family regulator
MGQKTSILNSELAVKILSAIASRTEGNYSTNLANELNKPQPSISRILTELHEVGLIKKGERKKVQYYQIDYDKVVEYWLEEIRKILEEYDKSESIERLDQNSDQILELASCFFKKVLEKTDPSGMTLERLLFDGFAYSMGHTMVKKDNLLEENPFIQPVLEGLKIYAREKEFCGDICKSMEKSVEETLE